MGKVLTYRCDSEIYFRVGIKHAEKQRFVSAGKFLALAAEKEPFNADYQFNYACILAELRETKKSSEILAWIIRNIDPTFSECYFAIACNYFEMENFKKAREYLEKYVQLDSEGEFAEEAQDIIYYLEAGYGMGKKRGRNATRLTAEGEKLLDEGDFKNARLKLEKAVDADPRFIAARNSLSIACFLSGQTDRAISIAKSVIKLDEYNIQANCNLALFYAYKGDMDLYKKQLEVLSEIEVSCEKTFLADMKQFLKTVLRDKCVKEDLKMAVVDVLQLKQTELQK